ncbi:MAG: methyltransferase domain-containing protein [Myxococcales bacterium]|nr:methyltransferase domain-containing protein [Myxococcales bacterium]
MSLYDRILGHPFVYHHVRPLVVGIDYTPQYEALDAGFDDRILDIGCGGGDALRYLDRFDTYHGFDTDEVAISFARQRPEAARPNVHFATALVSSAVLQGIRPTRVMMNGLLHHLDDEEAVGLLKMCAATDTVQRIVTNDTVYLPGEPLNNIMARLDRGRFVRDVQGYRDLVARARLTIASEEAVRSHPTRGIARYWVMVLER